MFQFAFPILFVRFRYEPPAFAPFLRLPTLHHKSLLGAATPLPYGDSPRRPIQSQARKYQLACPNPLARCRHEPPARAPCPRRPTIKYSLNVSDAAPPA